MKAVFEAMPRDLQQTMLSAPRRAELLNSLHSPPAVPLPGRTLRRVPASQHGGSPVASPAMLKQSSTDLSGLGPSAAPE
jgi:hypothetical protein